MRKLIGAMLFAFLCSSAASAQSIIPIAGIVHLQDLGDQPLTGGVWAGTKGQSRRLEGLALNLPDTYGALRIEYLCHLQDIGDVGYVTQGAFCGTRGQSRRLEAVEIRLAGPAARFFTVKYQCHLQDVGDTDVVADGATCGTRGESRRLEAVRVWIEFRH